MFSAVNTGHGQPYIKKKVFEQYERAHLLNCCARFAGWGPFAEMMCKKFGYDRITALCSGTEGADTACKLARKHGIIKRKIPIDKVKVLGVGDSYHGLATGCWGLMDRSQARLSYGIQDVHILNFNPTTNETLSYLDIEAMRSCLEEHHETVAAVVMEPLHGNTESTQREIEYCRAIYDLCRTYNILFIADEIRMGAAKTGKFLSHYHCGDDMKPDIVIMGKSITGGWYPHTFLLGTEEVMSLVGPSEIGGTYSHAPPAIAAASAVIELIDKENLMARAVEIEHKWKAIVSGWNHPQIDFNACIGADGNMSFKNLMGQRVAALCMHKGLFVNAFPGRKAIRITFALTITDEELEKGAAILKEVLDTIDDYEHVPGEFWGED